MTFKKAFTIGMGAMLSMGLVACGGPDIDQVKADFENPSGSTSNKNSVMAASGQANASGPARSLGASGVPGQGLTAHGKLRGFSEINTFNRYFPLAEYSFYRAVKHETRALRASQVDMGDCTNGEAKRATEEIFQELFLDAALGGSSASGSASFSMDMATCTDGRVTGTVDVELEIEVSENEFAFRVTEKLNNVCETDGEKACLDGTLLVEASATGNGMETGELTTYVAWDVSGNWEENGAKRSGDLKGGVRILLGANPDMVYGSIEYLIYAKAPDGEEYTFVYKLSAEWSGIGTGMGSLQIRGSDGTIDCTFDATMVTCTGSADLTWTAEEEMAVNADVFGG